MVLDVDGEDVCGYCTGDIAAAADKAVIKSLTVNDKVAGQTIYWQPGMNRLKEAE